MRDDGGMTGTATDVVLGLVLGLVVAWGALLVALVVASPGRAGVAEAMRLLPDVLRLLGRLARDPAVPRGARVRLWLALAYLAMPFDLVPDVLPVIGHADDVVVVVVALRSVVRRAGPATVERHWPGTPDGLAAVVRAAGLTGTGGAGGAAGR